MADSVLAAPPVTVAVLGDPAGHRAAASLLATIWPAPSGMPVSPELLRALDHAGGYVAGAFAGDELVGASVGFHAAPVDGRRVLHSHITGVLPRAQGAGVGALLKEHQRAWARARDIEVITWTFDPLVRRNGWFNLERLGAEITGYLPDFYGAMDDDINAGDESDRSLVSWPVDGDGGGRGTPAPAGARAVLRADGDGLPVTAAAPAGAHALLCAVPRDIVALRAAQPDAARRWRRAVRETMGAAMAEGWTATGMTPDGEYVLRRGEHFAAGS